MKEKEKLLKNTSLSRIKNWIENENDQEKKEVFRCFKSEKMNFDNNKMSEEIKVIDQNLLNVNGFIPYTKKIKDSLERGSIVVQRSYAEFDNRYRQLVSNGIILVYNEKENKYYFGFQKRKSNYAEISLSGTLGMVGGHVNVLDNTIYEGLLREISEELKGFSFEESIIKPVGFINEKHKIANISDYHLCVAYIIKIPFEDMGKIKNRESQEQLLWISETELVAKLKDESQNEMDSWVEILLNEILIKKSIDIS